MDIKQALNAEAALTLGKDMTLRDYAQGAYRMRGIGKGQKLTLLLVPEVKRLIDREVQHKDPTGSLAKDSVAWLVTNSFRSEKLQFMQLCVQNLSNVWRERAFDELMGVSGIDITKGPRVKGGDRGDGGGGRAQWLLWWWKCCRGRVLRAR